MKTGACGLTHLNKVKLGRQSWADFSRFFSHFFLFTLARDEQASCVLERRRCDVCGQEVFAPGSAAQRGRLQACAYARFDGRCRSGAAAVTAAASKENFVMNFCESN